MAKYRLNHEVSVDGKPVFKVGDSVEGTLVAKKNTDGTSTNVLYIKKDQHKVVIPEKWLDAEDANTAASASQPNKKRTPLLVWASPVAGLAIGLYVAKRRNGTTRDYIGWGFLGFAIGCIPTVLYFRGNMERMAAAAAKIYGRKQADKRSRSTALADSISLINKTQNGKELDSNSKQALQEMIDQQNFNQDEFKVLKEYVTLSNAVSIYGDDISNLSKEDQQKVEAQIKKIDALFEKINSNSKMKSFVDQLFGSQDTQGEKAAA